MMTPTHSATERDPQTHAIIGAAMEVHNELGPGFVEPVYRRPLEIELAARKILFQREVPFAISYKGTPTGRVYRVDFVCFSEVVVEISSTSALVASSFTDSSCKRRAERPWCAPCDRPCDGKCECLL